MDNLTQLAELLKKRDVLEREIPALIARPAAVGHIGEYIVSSVFRIALEESASHKSLDGRFSDEPRKERTVHSTWYALWEGLLDIAPDALPDYSLVRTGPKSPVMASRRQVRPWRIERVFLFAAQRLERVEARSRNNRHGDEHSAPSLGQGRNLSLPTHRTACSIRSATRSAGAIPFGGWRLTCRCSGWARQPLPPRRYVAHAEPDVLSAVSRLLPVMLLPSNVDKRDSLHVEQMPTMRRRISEERTMSRSFRTLPIEGL